MRKAVVIMGMVLAVVLAVVFGADVVRAAWAGIGWMWANPFIGGPVAFLSFLLLCIVMTPSA